jgi:hypothetical protein
MEKGNMLLLRAQEAVSSKKEVRPPVATTRFLPHWHRRCRLVGQTNSYKTKTLCSCSGSGCGRLFLQHEEDIYRRRVLSARRFFSFGLRCEYTLPLSFLRVQQQCCNQQDCCRRWNGCTYSSMYGRHVCVCDEPSVLGEDQPYNGPYSFFMQAPAMRELSQQRFGVHGRATSRH